MGEKDARGTHSFPLPCVFSQVHLGPRDLGSPMQETFTGLRSREEWACFLTSSHRKTISKTINLHLSKPDTEPKVQTWGLEYLL